MIDATARIQGYQALTGTFKIAGQTAALTREYNDSQGLFVHELTVDGASHGSWVLHILDDYALSYVAPETSERMGRR